MWNEALLELDKDFVIKTSIAHISGVDYEGFGLLWGLQDLNNYFSFNVTAGGHYRVNQETDGEWDGPGRMDRGSGNRQRRRSLCHDRGKERWEHALLL